MSVTVLPASEDDAEELLLIYAPYVTDTAISFEYEVPDVNEFRKRIREISSRYPYLKAVSTNGEILGYAYANTFKGRPAYDWSVETTIYLRTDRKGEGTGRALYEALEQALQKQGILNMNACIAKTREETPYLTDASLFFHEKMGFSEVGVFHFSGYKFDRWFDMVWMEKMIGPHKMPQEPVHFSV